MSVFKPAQKIASTAPLPPIGEMDYASIMKFLHLAEQRCREEGRSVRVYLSWAMHVLLTSLSADSASRIFLPKTETAPFQAEDLFPFSAAEPTGREVVALSGRFVIAPIWNNAKAAAALESVQEAGYGEEEPCITVLGYFFKDFNLAVIDSDVHRMYFSRLWGHGKALLNVYTLEALEGVVQTDGENWYVREPDGSETYCPVLEPRMAALYALGLKKRRVMLKKAGRARPVAEEAGNQG